jgi:propionate CoA-transferase
MNSEANLLNAVTPALRRMDARLFRPEPMNLKADMAKQEWPRDPRVAALNAAS